jgi:hypothetical protein
MHGVRCIKNLKFKLKIDKCKKRRINYFCFFIQKSKNIARTSQAVSFIKREDIKRLILQQEVRYGILKKSPIALYMDSFSELTDQMFINKKQKWHFYVNYSDINHTKEFEKEFESLGLLSVDSLIEEYRMFFSLFLKRYASVPIIFMHFPVKLDNREKFKLRYNKIKEAIDILETEFQPFYSFTANEEIVDWPEKLIPGLENFPYHYNQETYTDLVDKINTSGVFNQYK